MKKPPEGGFKSLGGPVQNRTTDHKDFQSMHLFWVGYEPETHPGSLFGNDFGKKG
jgi:hypothetical protein